MAPSGNRHYGSTTTTTTTTTEPEQNGTIIRSPDEGTAGLLLGRLKPEETNNHLSARLHRHFKVNVSSTWGDVALLFCYVITGLLDSSSVATWGSFASMQTGNSIYVGVGIIAPRENDRWLRALVSIISFLFGSFFFARYHRFFSPKRRWVIVSSYVIQLVMVTGAAVMVTLGPTTTPKSPITVWILVPIALVAFQSAGQAVISRVLKYNSLTSVVLTSLYCDLASDPKLFAPLKENPERNRRILAPSLLILGAILGGLWAHSEIGVSGALWTAVVLKFCVVLAWCFWASEREEP